VASNESPITMKKLIYISFIFVFILAFSSCKKEEIKPCIPMDADTRSNDDSFEGDDGTYAVRGGDDVLDGDIVDPDEDEDFDEEDEDIDEEDEELDLDKEDDVVDPDEEEDFDKNEGGGVVDPDEEEDFQEDGK
jgi:hypothetical protein